MRPASQVVVTGANGFIGRHLTVAQLALGRRVVAVDQRVGNLDSIRHDPNLTIVETDIRDTEALSESVSGADIVFNLAAAHLEVTATDSHFRAVNVDAMARLLELSESAGVGRFVHCSTVGVYGPIENLPADEAFALAKRFEFYFTPKSASWLNMIEIEFSALARLCLNRRIPTIDQLEKEVLAFLSERSSQKIKINWQFSIQSARSKLNSHYVAIHDDNIKFKKS